MSFYWVNIGVSKNFVRRENFLWAPQYGINKLGNKYIDEGWLQVPHVKHGDVIFCCYKQKIVFVAIATSDAYDFDRPDDPAFETWFNDGYRIDVELQDYEYPLDINVLKPTLNAYHNDRCVPPLLTKSNGLRQNYLTLLPEAAGAFILDELGDSSFDIQTIKAKHSASKSKPGTKRTGKMRDVISKARVGQGPFRADVLALWDNTCPVTNLQAPELLIASHIVSWQLSDEQEKVDMYNGFPFSPDVDKLFDKGLISFSDNGELLVHPKCDLSTLQKLGVDTDAKIALKGTNATYLRRHREIHGF